MNRASNPAFSLSAETGTMTLGAVDKALVILTLLTTSAEPLPLVEVCRRTGLPKATAHRLLAVLCAHEMVMRSNYKYSSRWSTVAFQQQNSDPLFLGLLKDESTPFLVELHNITDATATVSALVNGRVHHVNQVYGHRGVRVNAMSARVPAAIDKILCAYGPTSQRHFTPDLFEIRRTGIAHSDECEAGVASVAVPLGSTPSEGSVALSISGRIRGVDLVTASKELRRKAFELNRTIKRRLLATSAFASSCFRSLEDQAWSASCSVYRAGTIVTSGVGRAEAKTAQH